MGLNFNLQVSVPQWWSVITVNFTYCSKSELRSKLRSNRERTSITLSGSSKSTKNGLLNQKTQENSRIIYESPFSRERSQPNSARTANNVVIVEALVNRHTQDIRHLKLWCVRCAPTSKFRPIWS